MNHTVKLSIAIGLGAAAAIFNWMSFSQGTNVVKFATLVESVEMGETITTDNIGFVTMESRQAEALKASLVQFKDRATLSGKTAPRTLERGTLLLLMPFCIFLVWSSWDYVSVSWEIREASRESGGRHPSPGRTLAGHAGNRLCRGSL